MGEYEEKQVTCGRCGKTVGEFSTLPWLGISETVCFSCQKELSEEVRKRVEAHPIDTKAANNIINCLHCQYFSSNGCSLEFLISNPSTCYCFRIWDKRGKTR